ncbi:MAG: alpha/beta hydrolase [Flavobacterium sp.]|nr:alpha/beta hydrolase [Flavobacterium sp.]
MENYLSNYNKKIDVTNIKISYNDVGIGKIPILFLHGFPFNKSMWEEQLEFLKDSHRLISIDIRSFGQSLENHLEVSIDLFTNDLIQFMNALGLKKVILCGLSMGGFIALNAVKKHPKRFAALVLCDTQCASDTEEQKAKRMETIQEIEANGISKFTASFLKAVFHEDSLSNKIGLVAKIEADILANSPAVLIGGLKALASRQETCSSLDKIEIPTLIICGREDQVTPLSQSELMHQNIENSILKIIENAGHLSNLEQPEAFNAALLEFLLSEPIISMTNSVKEPNSNLFV